MTTLTQIDDVRESDAAVIAGVAMAATEPSELDPTVVYGLTVPPGAQHQVLDLERFLPAPRRKQGTFTFHTAESLVGYVNEHNVDGCARVWANVDQFQVAAVFNGHDSTAPGWGDHQAVLTLRPTPEWLAWVAQDRKMLSQVEFAELIEDRLDDIVEPDAASLLELARTFEAKTNVDFESGIVLESGQRQITYKETIVAKAGQGGTIEIPKQFVLGVAPFQGGDPYRVEARLRYRLKDGGLTLGYQLVRPDLVQRDAFEQTVGWVASATSTTTWFGTPR